jgi:hypothetical protein
MSWQATTAVIGNSNHKGTELLVLIMLSNYAGPDGESIFPSIKRLSDDCRMSERSVQYSIQSLIKSGELLSAGKTSAGVNVYRIPIKLLVRHGVQTLHPPGADFAPPPVQTLHPPVQTVAPNQSDNPSHDKGHKVAKATSSPSAKLYAEAFDIFKQCFPEWKHRSAPVRDRAILRFMKKFGAPGLISMVAEAKASDFLFGRNGYSKTWKSGNAKVIDPSWLFRKGPDGAYFYEKVVAGDFNNINQAPPVESWSVADVLQVFVEADCRTVKIRKQQLGKHSEGARYEIIDGHTQDGNPAVTDAGQDWSVEKYWEERRAFFERHPEELDEVVRAEMDEHMRAA